MSGCVSLPHQHNDRLARISHTVVIYEILTVLSCRLPLFTPLDSSLVIHLEVFGSVFVWPYETIRFPHDHLSVFQREGRSQGKG
jgi:hypothetical protein